MCIFFLEDNKIELKKKFKNHSKKKWTLKDVKKLLKIC